MPLAPSRTKVREVPVWDRFVRAFHWSNAVLVAIALLSTDAKVLHEDVGYAVLVLVAARIVWGFVGPQHARFSDFVTGPRTLLAYARASWEGRPRRYIGHNPAGAAMVIAMIAMLLVACISGWMSETDRFFGVPWVDHLHHISGHLVLILVGLHLAGVALSSWLHRENLVRAMVTGRKPLETGTEPQNENRAASLARLDMR